jgi:hypothetical protein
MFGQPITKARVEAKAKQYPSWYTADKINRIFAPLYDKGYLGYDCVGLVKGVLWEGNYASNGVPDISADAMIGRCKSVSTDFSSIAVGEFVWLKGHCGIYIGEGKVVESTPAWNNGVQITNLSARNWQKHGKLPYIEYSSEEVKSTVTIELSVLRKGSKGEEVKTLQRLLKSLTFNGKDGGVLLIDGSFGTNTEYALRSYQKANSLEVDGICGKNSWNSILK